MGVGTYSTTLAADAKLFDLPTSSLSIGAEQVHVIRSTWIDLAGGIGDSRFRIGHDESNDIVLHP
ncbi:MAG: hypothetical protein V3T05_00085 [Myxococcota bacterium]